jgi:hypothetical protein
MAIYHLCQERWLVFFERLNRKADDMAKPKSANSVRRGRRIGIFVYDGVMALDGGGVQLHSWKAPHFYLNVGNRDAR